MINNYIKISRFYPNMVELVIDNRENIKDLLIENIPEAKLENLEIGDYIFKVNDKPFLISLNGTGVLLLAAILRSLFIISS